MDTRLQNLPVSFFSSVMGIAGLSIVLQQAGARVVNGWKNSTLPWDWKLEQDVMYALGDG